MRTFLLYWSPEGKQIATVEAVDRKAAIRKAPKPYRKYRGEIYAVEVLVTRYLRIFTIRWLDDGTCRVTSTVNGCRVGSWEHGEWYDWRGLEVPDDVRALAMECRP